MFSIFRMLLAMSLFYDSRALTQLAMVPVESSTSLNIDVYFNASVITSTVVSRMSRIDQDTVVKILLEEKKSFWPKFWKQAGLFHFMQHQLERKPPHSGFFRQIRFFPDWISSVFSPTEDSHCNKFGFEIQQWWLKR